MPSFSLSMTDKPARLAAIIGLLCAPVVGYAATVSPRWTTIIVAGLAVASLFVTYPMLSIYALFIGTFFDALYLDVGFAKLGAGDLGAILLIGSWLGNLILQRNRFRWPVHGSLLFVYFVLTFASLMLGVSPAKGYGFFIRLLIYGLSLVAIVDLLRDIVTFERLSIVLILCSIAHAIIGMNTIGGGNSRMYGLVNQPNILGVQLAFGLIPLAAWMARVKHIGYRTILGVLFSLLLFSIVLTMSRGTYVALTLAFLWWFRKSKQMLFAVCLASALSFVLLGSFASKRVERIEQRLEFNDSSVVNRGVVAGNAVKAVMHHPILGVGYGQFSDLDKAVSVTAEKGRGAHNFYLGTAASSGLPALFCLLLFALLQARTIQRNRRRLSRQKGPDYLRIDWMVTMIQIMMIFHVVNLGMRGSQRLTEWAMLSLYAAAALLVGKPQQEAVSATPDEIETPEQHVPLQPE